MAGPAAVPTVVIVGRPNVGKSTLFNAITGTRRSIVADEPGITRDRIYGEAIHRQRPFTLIDTGGIIPDDERLIPTEIIRQAGVALDQAAVVLFVIDGRTEITSADRDLAQMLRRLGKRVIVAVNKIDVPKREDLLSGFHEFGFEEVMPVSAEHKLYLNELLDAATQDFPRVEEAEEPAKTPIRVAIIGRPNAGKSTLLNSLVGAERAIVSPVAGTTRDSVDETIEHDGVEFVFVDTAGIRRKGKTIEMAEKLSVVMARRSIRMSHVVVLVMDALEGVVSSDATIAGYADEGGRALILAVNKWDAVEDKNNKKVLEQVRREIRFAEYAQVVFLSAKTGAGVKQLFPLIRRAYDAASKRVPTGELNRFSETLDFGPDTKVYYITQASIRPPTFVLFTNQRKELHFSIERFVANRLREKFGFEGTPVVVKTRVKTRDPRK
jgi:GTP-binding protein